MRRVVVALVVAVVGALAAACGPDAAPDEPAPTPTPTVAGVCTSLPPDNPSCPFDGEAVWHWKLGFRVSNGECRVNLPLCEDGRGFGVQTECSTCRQCQAKATGRFVVHLPDGSTAGNCGE